MFGWTAGHSFKGKRDVFCLSPSLFIVCKRGSNALLIYHSSVLTAWSSSDKPHLAPPADVYLSAFRFHLSSLCACLNIFSCSFCVGSSLYLFRSLFTQGLLLFFPLSPLLLSPISVRFGCCKSFPLCNSKVSEIYIFFTVHWLSLSSSLYLSLSPTFTQSVQCWPVASVCLPWCSLGPLASMADVVALFKYWND